MSNHGFPNNFAALDIPFQDGALVVSGCQTTVRSKCDAEKIAIAMPSKRLADRSEVLCIPQAYAPVVRPGCDPCSVRRKDEACHNVVMRLHCFENVTALVFLVSLSEYDQMLYEDESVVRSSSHSQQQWRV